MNKKITLTIIMIMALTLMVSTAYALPNPTINLNLPTLTQGTQGNLQITVTTNETFNGTINITYQNITGNSPIAILESDFSGGSAQYTTGITGSNAGQYSVSANLTDSTGNITRNANGLGQTTDNTAPQVTSTGPSGPLTSSAITLTVNTNEASTCKFSTTDQSYSAMPNIFATTGGTTHTNSLSLADGNYLYYVRCADTGNNAMQTSAEITFTITTNGYADISLDKESPLTAGIVEVSVVSSRNLNDATLNYYYADTPSVTYQVPLAGMNNLWKGYMIVPEAKETRIGTFIFSGNGANGQITTRINSGKLFIVDTTRPDDLTDVSATGEAYQIRLKWFYDGETGKFNVYKSDSSDVSYVDLYEDTNESFFADRNVNPDKTYYYRIAAVTNSGNVGPLSNLVYAKALKEVVVKEEGLVTVKGDEKNEEIVVKKQNSIETLRLIEEKLDEISDVMLDVDKSQEDLADNTDSIEKNAIDNLGLLEEISDAKDRLSEMKRQLEEYRDAYVEESILNKTASQMDLKIKKILSTIPKKLSVLDKMSFIQDTGADDIISASNQVLNESDVKSSLKENNKINEVLKVEVNYKLVELTYLDDTRDQKTIVEKSISYESPESIKNAVIVETIPKSVALYAEDISFKTKYVRILKNDPVIALDAEELSFDPVKLVYVLNEKKDSEEVKKTKTVAIIRSESNGNLLSGLAIFSGESGGSTLDIIAIIGIIVLIGLIGYYFMFVREQPFKTKTKELRGLMPGQGQTGTSYEEVYSNAPKMSFSEKRTSSAMQNKIAKNHANIKRLVNEGHYHIDNMNFEAAQDVYKKAVIEYGDGQGIPIYERTSIETSMNSLYNKLLLISKINEAHNYINQNNAYRANAAMAQVNSLYNQVVQRNNDTALCNYAYQWNNHLRNKLNQL